mgnify:FL=1
MKFRGKEGAKANIPKSMLPFFAKIFQSKKVYWFFQKMYRLYVSFLQSSEKIQKEKRDNAKKLLDDSWHIGIISDLDESLKYLFKEIGVPVKWKNSNVTEKKNSFFKLDEETRRKIYKDNKYDLELYNYALEKTGKIKEKSKN